MRSVTFNISQSFWFYLSNADITDIKIESISKLKIIISACKSLQARRKSSANSGARGRAGRSFTMNGDGMIEVIPLSAISIPDKDPAVDHWQISCVTCSPPPRQPSPPKKTKSVGRRRRRAPRYNSVSKIDRASRVVFPLFFLAINLFYWYAYLSRSERMQYYNSNTAWSSRQKRKGTLIELARLFAISYWVVENVFIAEEAKRDSTFSVMCVKVQLHV